MSDDDGDTEPRPRCRLRRYRRPLGAPRGISCQTDWVSSASLILFVSFSFLPPCLASPCVGRAGSLRKRSPRSSTHKPISCAWSSPARSWRTTRPSTRTTSRTAWRCTWSSRRRAPLPHRTRSPTRPRDHKVLYQTSFEFNRTQQWNWDAIIVISVSRGVLRVLRILRLLICRRMQSIIKTKNTEYFMICRWRDETLQHKKNSLQICKNNLQM